MGTNISADQKKFHAICQHFSPNLFFDEQNPDMPTWDAKRKVCEKIIDVRFDWAQRAYLDSKVIKFPGDFVSTTASDLGVIGQIGMLLILLWGFFAIRRENHSIRTFVDRDETSHKTGRVMPDEFILVPQDKHLSSEHYAFAYHSVSERFVFLFSRYSRPVLFMTMLLFLIPGLVAAINFAWDATYFYLYDGLVEPSIYVRVAFEFGLLVLVLVVSGLQIRLTLETSTLLNGWYLAARDVWTPRWDERDQDEAAPVHIDVRAQIATFGRVVSRTKGR